MSATDELRKLLEERGVTWSNVDNNGDVSDYYTEWYSDDDEIRMTAKEYSWSCGNLSVTAWSELSPCQAAAMIDLRGTCKWELVHSGTLYDKWQCSCCGYEFVEPRTDQGYTEMEPNFCPNCGREIEQ